MQTSFALFHSSRVLATDAISPARFATFVSKLSASFSESFECSAAKEPARDIRAGEMSASGASMRSATCSMAIMFNRLPVLIVRRWIDGHRLNVVLAERKRHREHIHGALNMLFKGVSYIQACRGNSADHLSRIWGQRGQKYDITWA